MRDVIVRALEPLPGLIAPSWVRDDLCEMPVREVTVTYDQYEGPGNGEFPSFAFEFRQSLHV